MTGLAVHVHAESALDVAPRNALSCQEIIKVGVESGANKEFKGVNNSYLHEEGGKERREEGESCRHFVCPHVSFWVIIMAAAFHDENMNKSDVKAMHLRRFPCETTE